MPHLIPRPQDLHRRTQTLLLALVLLALGATTLAGPVPAARGADLLGTTLTLDEGAAQRAEVGARLQVTGQVRTQVAGSVLGDALDAPDIGRGVSLQVWSDTGWRTVSSTLTGLDGRFSLPAPTYYAGHHRYRVEAAGTLLRRAAATETRTIRVALGYRPAGRSTSWSPLLKDGARWDPCTTIPFYVNPAGAPRKARALVTKALRLISVGSGLRFRYAGPTPLVPWRDGRPPRKTFPHQGIAVAWSTGSRVNAIAGTPLGYGGPWLETTYDAHGTRRTAAVAGGVVIDRDYPLAPRFGKGRTLGWVLVHELGHVVGLDHVDDPRQVMHGMLRDASSTRLGAGDLAGLRRLGADRGCL